MPIAKRALVDIQTGTAYKSVSEAAKALDLTPQMVCYMSKPQRFRYLDEIDTSLKNQKKDE